MAMRATKERERDLERERGRESARKFGGAYYLYSQPGILPSCSCSCIQNAPKRRRAPGVRNAQKTRQQESLHPLTSRKKPGKEGSGVSPPTTIPLFTRSSELSHSNCRVTLFRFPGRPFSSKNLSSSMMRRFMGGGLVMPRSAHLAMRSAVSMPS